MAKKHSVSPASAASPVLADRVAALQKRLTKLDADALLVTNAVDIRYLTGFAGDDSWAIVPATGKKVHVLTDFRFQEQVQREAPQVIMTLRSGPMADALGKLHEKLGIDTLAVQSEHLTVSQHKSLKKKLGKKHIEPIDDGLLKQRAVKSPDEIKAIRAALAIQQQAFVDLRDVLKPGETERQIAASLEFLMRSAGADGPSFPTIIAADANASLPHAVPGDRKLKASGSVLIDFGARAGGYCSDLTRVVGLGSMPAKIKEIYKVVLEAQLAAIAAIKPGAKLRDIDAAARNVIVKAGYGPQFGHSTGHGIGLDIHEQPTLSARSEGSLEPGHVVTVEPGIYLPGVGGVRIEDDVLVTAKGHEVLSDLPKSLESAII